MAKQVQKPMDGAYILSLITGLALASFALKMLQFPTSTQQPSFINCFNYIEPTKGLAMFWAAIVISGSVIWLSIARRKTVIVFIEAAMIWVVAYFALVGVSSAPYANTVSGVAQALIMLGAVAVVWLLVVRWVLKRNDR